jgi:hypothetical protein
MEDNTVRCPLVDEVIDDIECIETSDAVKEILKEESVPSKFKAKSNWKDICKQCKYHNY